MTQTCGNSQGEVADLPSFPICSICVQRNFGPSKIYSKGIPQIYIPNIFINLDKIDKFMFSLSWNSCRQYY